MDFPAVAGASRWWIVLLALAGALAAAASLSVVLLPARLAYDVDGERIVVEATVGPFDFGRTIARADLQEVQKARLSGGARTAGFGRPGFCVGRWRYPDIGAVWQGTTCGASTVLLTTPAGRYVVEPADRDAFVAAVEAGTPGRFEPPARDDDRSVWSPLVALVVLSLLGTVPLMARIARPLRYVVRDGVLHVPAHFADVKVPLRGARVSRGAMGGWRVAGSSMPGFRLGLFSDARGRYHAAATATTGVWVEAGRRVFVTPAEQDRFVAALLAAGAQDEGAQDASR